MLRALTQFQGKVLLILSGDDLGRARVASRCWPPTRLARRDRPRPVDAGAGRWRQPHLRQRRLARRRRAAVRAPGSPHGDQSAPRADGGLPFPPLAGGGDIERTVGFARHLPECGWQPLVLSPRPLAYAQQDHAADRASTVRRTLALDAARHPAIAGRYPRCLALPDRWSSWWLSAVPAGLR
jgi:hypothetical protein